MSSEIEICNLALSNIRAGSINSLDEGSLQSQICSLKYERCRNMVLSTGVWGFARKLVGLGLLTTEVYNWTYSYQYPSDCLKINRLIGSQEQLLNADASTISHMADSGLLQYNELRKKIPYEVFNFTNNKVIGANESDLYIDYVVKVTDPNLFTEAFELALSHLLGAEIAVPIVGVENGRQLRSDCLTMYKEYLATAEADDLNETQSTPLPSEYETVRR